MAVLETVRRFRTQPEPITTIWRLGELAAVGTLVWPNGKPELKLILELDQNELLKNRQLKHPWLSATKPPMQPCIVALKSEIGQLTLENCAQRSVITPSHYGYGKSQCEIYLQPTRVWLGDPGQIHTKPMQQVRLEDTRLGGFFRYPGFRSHLIGSENHPELYNALDHPDEIWAFKSYRGEPIVFGKTGFKLRLEVICSHGMSATEGYNYNTVDCLTLEPPPNTDRHTCEEVVYQLQNLLTVISFEDFAFEGETYFSEKHGRSTTLWALGDRGASFDPPMDHQILADLHEPQILQQACNHWFDASEVVRLSRWLFCKAVRESDDGIARFITIAQALEVLGRELSPAAKLVDKSIRNSAVCAVGAAVTAEPDISEDYAKRIVQLVQNSNSTSYADSLREMMEPVANVILPVAQVSYPGEVQSLTDFTQLISRTRNAVIHMTSDKREDLDQAFRRVPKLSYLIGFCYAVIQANMLSLPLTKAHNFLANNRRLRHGLPNEFLERPHYF